MRHLDEIDETFVICVSFLTSFDGNEITTSDAGFLTNVIYTGIMAPPVIGPLNRALQPKALSKIKRPRPKWKHWPKSNDLTMASTFGHCSKWTRLLVVQCQLASQNRWTCRSIETVDVFLDHEGRSLPVDGIPERDHSMTNCSKSF
jgi:hypothetical protein